MLRHHYPFVPFGRLVMERHHYPLTPCAPYSGKSRFDLLYILTVSTSLSILYFFYFIYARAIRMPPWDFASRQRGKEDVFQDKKPTKGCEGAVVLSNMQEPTERIAR